jgi:hypothetical protein
VKITFRIGNPHNVLPVKQCSVVPKQSTLNFYRHYTCCSWGILHCKIYESYKEHFLNCKILSLTLCACVEVCVTPAQKYECIVQVLNDKSDTESGKTLRDYNSLIKEMKKHETALMCNKVLERFATTNNYKSLKIHSVVKNRLCHDRN